MVPFAKLKAAVKSENKEREELRIAELFLKKMFPDKAASKLMSEVKRQMVVGLNAAQGITCVVDVPFQLFITSESCNAHCLLTGDFRNNKTIQWAMARVGQAAARQEECAVLFKINTLGVFVLHNVSMPMQANPRIIIPASKAGVSQIQIINLDFFAQDFLGRRKTKEE